MPGVVTPGHRQVDWRDSVRFATAAVLSAHTGTGTSALTATVNGALAVDGGAPVAGDRILVKDQAGAAAIDNLVWVVRQPGTPGIGGTPWILDRAADDDTSEEVTYGFTVRVEGGATQADSGWSITTNDPITLGTTLIAWTASPAGAGFAAAGALSSIELGDAAGAGVALTVPRGDHQHAVNLPLLNRQTLGADSTLTGVGMGPATETAHTPITFTAASGLLGTPRRTIPFRAMLNPLTDNGADTWRTRVRFGAAGVGAGTVVLVDSTAFDSVVGQGLYIEGTIQILTTGAFGTFASYCRLVNEATGTVIESFVASGAIDTTQDRDLTVSGESSTNNANQQMTLRHFEAEVLAA